MTLLPALIASVKAAEVALAATDPNMIRVWRYRDAPEELRALSRHGGDEDWLAVLPPGMEEEPLWTSEGSSFGCCSVSSTELAGGVTVLIGAHA